jgi:hypothetical protein
MKKRHSEYDVENTVQVTDAQAVRNAVLDIFHSCYLKANDSYLKQAFEDFDNLFEGHFKDYTACDTFYHDKQHTLDMTLALARLIHGHERQSDSHHTFGAMQVSIALITALFHDSGYIRKKHDQRHHNGAEYTRIHVSRSSNFLHQYLTMIGLGEYAEIAANMVHYTGYEVAPKDIKLPNEKLHMLGHMLGTADLIGQMADRCYLEKCRDRLYPEFLLGGMTETTTEDGNKQVIFESGDDLLSKTPDFYNNEVEQRLNVLFNQVYRYAGIHFNGENLYLSALAQNIGHIESLIKEDNQFGTLKRMPPENYGSKTFLNSSGLKKH